jgi:hypothetical protein
MKVNPMCLDCVEAIELCDTCAFLAVRIKWQRTHGQQPPEHLWWAAREYGGRHVLRQVKRHGWRHDVMIQRAPRRAR